MVAKKKPGKVSEAYVVKRPASPQLRPPTGSARALSRTANAYANACSIPYWGTPRWEAVLEARREVGRGLFRAMGAPFPSTGKSTSHTLARKWFALEGYADGEAAREATRAGQSAFFALRFAASLDLKVRRTRPLDEWFAAFCAREGRPHTAPPTLVSEAQDAEQLRALLAERELALLNAGTPKTLERAWDTVHDDGWEGADRTRLEASRAARAKTLDDKLATRVLKAKTERALRLAWNAATKAGRADELAPLRATALSRLGLEDPQAASLAA